MTLIDRGSGDPVVVVPGIQGRWPYVEATIDALARTHRVLTFSLAGERDGRRFAPGAGLDNYLTDIDNALTRSGTSPVTLVGVSFGGIVALRFAARHPDRVRALVLVSVPGPDWALVGRHRWYLRAPALFGLLFLLESPLRVGPEIRSAFASTTARARFSLRQLRTFAHAPLSFSRMATRAVLAEDADRMADARQIDVPTLVVTGEERLDRVVPVAGTRQYVRLIEGARAKTLRGTGHLGSLTHADRFADVVDDFLDSLRHAAA